MKVDITSLFVNSYIQNATATAAWATSIGQKKSDNCKIDVRKNGVQDILNGMIYKSLTDRSLLDISKASDNRDIILVSKFDKVYINNLYQEDLSYILLLCREMSKSHFGRLLVSYPPYVLYSNKKVNKITMDRIGQVLGCTPIGCWFVSEISVQNQDELHFKAHIVNKDKSAVYSGSSSERSKVWQGIVEKDKSEQKIVFND